MKNQNTKDRLISSIILVIISFINITAHIINGGFEHTYVDDLLAVPMIYFTIKIIFTEDIKFLPEIIFAIRAAIQGIRYLTEQEPAFVNDINFSGIVRIAAPYAKAALYCFAGMMGLRCGMIAAKILRRTYDHKSRQKRRLMIAELTCIILVFSCAAEYMVWEDNAISVSHYTYESDKISQSLDGYKIVQVSDLHNKSFGEDSIFLIKKIKAEHPDIIIVTGDLVDSNRTDIDTALEFVRNAAEIAPLYYITGNHEDALSMRQINKLNNGIEEAGGVVLQSEFVIISRSQGMLYRGDNSIDFDEAGILYNAPDDVFNLIGLANSNLFHSKIHYITPHSQNLNILLAHQPQVVDNYTTEPVDLIFSGHAHGGQFRLPLIGPVYAPGQGFRPTYTEGVYRVNGASMVVSRGLGNSIFPIRINNRPELVVVELKHDF